MMGEYLALFISAVVINNFVLTKFLGLCIFFGISKNLSASAGMGVAVTAVMTMSSILAWIVYNFILAPLGLTFLTTIVFVILTASFVQLLELIIKKEAPTLYNMWGIYLLLIATNCIVLAVPLLNVENSYSLLRSPSCSWQACAKSSPMLTCRSRSKASASRFCSPACSRSRSSVSRA